MTNAVETAPSPAPLVKYDIDEAKLAELREKCAGLTADTSKGYEEVRIAIGHLRDTRGAIERRRVELKADALAFGRLVDSEAKRITGLIAEIEDPLKLKKEAVDDEKARIKAEEEAVKVRALEAEIAANRERQEAEARAVRDAEEARLAAERERIASERQQLEAERARLDEAARIERERAEAALVAERARLAEVEAAQRIEREAIEAERRAVAAERERAEREEFERQARVKAEEDAKIKAERDRVEAAELQARIEAVKPDLEKVRAFALSIRALVPPKVKSKKVAAFLVVVVGTLATCASNLDDFAAAPKAVA